LAGQDDQRQRKMDPMRKRLVLATTATMLAILLGGCAVVTNVRRQDGDSETHVFSVLGIPLWMDQTPIER
jgi:hypothetical protein